LPAIRAGVGGLVGQEPGGVVGVIPAGGGTLGDLLPGRDQRLAHLGRHHRRDLVLLGVKDPGGPPHPVGPVVETSQAIAGGGRRGGGQGALQVRLAHLVIGLHGLPVGGVDGRDRHGQSPPSRRGIITAAALRRLARIALAYT
jgi:hypothetical protein